MPAITYQSIETALSRFVKSSNSFRDTINMVMPQIYQMGYWRDTIFEISIDVVGGSFALPSNAESILAADVAGVHSTPESRWYDYKIVGTHEILGLESSIGLVDDGFSPVVRELDHEQEHRLVINPSRAAILPATGSIAVEFIDADGLKGTETFTLAGEAELLSTATNILSITSIIYTDVPETVEVLARTSDVAVAVSLSEGRGSTVSRYRKFRIPSAGDTTQRVDLLVKRAFTPLLDNNDIEYLGNLAAIKHALMATISEDNADYERSGYYWKKCNDLLEKEILASNGSIKPKPKTKAVGGVKGAIPNIM